MEVSPARRATRWNWRMVAVVFILAGLFLQAQSWTDPQDVFALSVLYASLNSPPLTGWSMNPVDPCGELWQGIQCAGPNITGMDLNNNSIGQMVPYQLPPRIQEINFANNEFTETLPYSMKDLISLISFNMSNNQIVGPVPDMFQSLTSLTSLDLSGNQFSGPLPPSMGALTSLITLHMENNSLSGDIGVLGQLQQLQDLDITNNGFSGQIPPSLLTIPSLKITGNQFGSAIVMAPAPAPFLFAPASAPSMQVLQQPSTVKQNPDQKSPLKGPVISGVMSRGSRRYWSAGKIAGVVVASALALLAGLLVILFFCGRTNKDEEGTNSTKDEEKRSSKSHPLVALDRVSREMFAQPKADRPLTPPPAEKSKLSIEKSPAMKSITPTPGKASKLQIAVPAISIAELQAATNSFSQENLVGEGALGRVYRAEIDDKIVAVKKLDTSAPMVQNEDEFIKVVSNLARLRHSNITELVGYCTEHSQRLLVYDFVEYGTLFEVLHCSDESSRRLSWNQRVKIALGAARALEYLHEVYHPAIVHRNFKSVNILLDEELNPRVSDCGLAALAPYGAERQVSSQMLVSFGYSAPEFAMSGVYTVKSDVYSFGVVMLELLTGRKSLDSSRSRAEQSLVRWAVPQLHDIDALSRMVDPALKGIYPAKSLSRFADIISSCVQPEPEFRPPMSEVVQALVRLMQRASLSKRRLTADDLGSSQRSLDRYEPSDSSA
ncbi:protein STRUBBELIG-RECEPTOR FAMILY 8 [Selaginella moellendorffii]|uniref:protein STRUBBELIG-RECEPTOR FAMILY 8 n=1 Tax=Selaginella moellendorffii TaxID=88036 RepID=UPI000D1C7B78|nr:protein STRUBBELIG-RECEPTOR FAMILY 8 [Selaginella moellendorffii]|eukprot:XP_002991949.2 protein STRUBBELIG-RECEPTOR FAMILY 8 [Selaginella moellendorffii]